MADQDEDLEALQANPDNDQQIQAMIEKQLAQKNYNDSSFNANSHVDYPGYINKQTSDLSFTDEEWANRMPKDAQQMEEINSNIREGGPATPLDTLIAKMASGTATREEKMRFYNITGKPI